MWKFATTITDGQTFFINGLNIWDYEWKNTEEKISIKDPLYNQPYDFNIYEIKHNNLTAMFAAGEFSNLIWGIYLEE
jgi:hypothetical protein